MNPKWGLSPERTGALRVNAGRYPIPTMDFKRIFRGPLLYIVIAVIVVWVGSSLLTGSGFHQITTEQGLKYLSDGQVSQAKIVDTDQRVDLTLKAADSTGSKQVQFYYVAPRGQEIVKAVDSAYKAGKLQTFNDEVPQPSWLLSVATFLVPILLLGLFFWFIMSGMQGGGNRVMQFGKSRAKLVSKETPKVTFNDVAGSDEAIEELGEI